MKYKIVQTRYLRSLVSGEVQITTEISAEIEALTSDQALEIFAKGLNDA